MIGIAVFTALGGFIATVGLLIRLGVYRTWYVEDEERAFPFYYLPAGLALLAFAAGLAFNWDLLTLAALLLILLTGIPAFFARRVQIPVPGWLKPAWVRRLEARLPPEELDRRLKKLRRTARVRGKGWLRRLVADEAALIAWLEGGEGNAPGREDV